MDEKNIQEQKLAALLIMESQKNSKWTLSVSENGKITLGQPNGSKMDLEDSDLCRKIIKDIETLYGEELDISNDQILKTINGVLFGKQVKICKICEFASEPGTNLLYIINFFEKNGKVSNLSEYRKKANMSQEQLAIKSGISIAAIRKYEQDPDSILSAKYITIRALSQALHCSVEDIAMVKDIPFVLEELYPKEEMREPLLIIKECCMPNGCMSKAGVIYVTGSVGSGVTTLTKCIASYAENCKIIGGQIIVDEDCLEHKEIRNMICIRLGMIADGNRIIKSIERIGYDETELLWKYENLTEK